MMRRQLVFPAILLVLAALAISGCASPTPTPEPPVTTIETPQEAVTMYWQAIDRGDYDAAYDLAYPVQNVSRQQWIDKHRAMWGDNGTNIHINNFTVIGNATLDPASFPGNFSGYESVIVQTDVSYYGKNTTGTSQFAAVKADGSWKFFGSY